eukprot:9092108-Heterocapsa_arctica.AAC.1
MRRSACGLVPFLRSASSLAVDQASGFSHGTSLGDAASVSFCPLPAGREACERWRPADPLVGGMGAAGAGRGVQS